MPTAWSRSRAKRGRPRGSSRTNAASRCPGSRGPRSSASPPGPRRPTWRSSGLSPGCRAAATPSSRSSPWPPRTSTSPFPQAWTEMASALDSLDSLDSTAPQAARPASNLQDCLAACAARIDAEIALVLEAEVEDPWLRGAISYQFGWAGADFVPVPAAQRAAGGKRLRPALSLLCYQGARLRQGWAADESDEAIPFATALELVHNYSLIHDDIQDRDLLRRGRPTVWSICGKAQAINVGNCLHAAAFACLGRQRAPGNGTGVGDVIAALATASMQMTGGQRQ